MIWLDNGGTAGDLDTFFRKAHGMTAEQQDAALETRLSYLNALYGSSVGNIPFREVSGYAFPLVAYAITRRQNAFLRLIESNFDLFRRLPYNNMLFDEEFYTRIRLNSITLKNLEECEAYNNDRKGNPLHHLVKREYTFDEMKALFKARRIYAAFYNSLRIERTDERLLTLRQMLKRELLDGLNNDQVESVAARLSEKPFMAWKDSVFAHIAGLTPKQCVRLLYAYDSVKCFLPEIHTANEAAFLIRHGDKLEAFSDWNSVKESIGQIDTAWEKLRKELQLDDAFVREHEQEILNFLYQEGASIATVRRAWHTEHNRPVISTELKTKAARRDIPLPKRLVDCLKEAKKNAKSEFVIANSEGQPLSYTQFKRVWQYIVTRSTKERSYVRYVNGKKIRHTVNPILGEVASHNGRVKYSLDFQVTPHQLRHTYITNLIAASVDPKTVQYLAGHENSKITMDIYAKVKYNKPRELLAVVNSAFGQDGGN